MSEAEEKHEIRVWAGEAAKAYRTQSFFRAASQD